jgi:hypothetical protein
MTWSFFNFGTLDALHKATSGASSASGEAVRVGSPHCGSHIHESRGMSTMANPGGAFRSSRASQTLPGTP